MSFNPEQYNVLQHPDIEVGDVVLVTCRIKWRGNTGAYCEIITDTYTSSKIIYVPLDALEVLDKAVSKP